MLLHGKAICSKQALCQLQLCEFSAQALPLMQLTLEHLIGSYLLL